jgi:four helix bundle protein
MAMRMGGSVAGSRRGFNNGGSTTEVQRRGFDDGGSTTEVRRRRFDDGGSTTGGSTTGSVASSVLVVGAMARTFRELEVWQLAVELRDRVLPMLKIDPVRRDFKFCEQLADSVRSPARNIAEGFGRFNPPETSQFVGYARASLDETENHLRDGVASSYFPAEKIGPLIKLCVRCRKGLDSWDAYLRRVRNDPRFSRRRR